MLAKSLIKRMNASERSLVRDGAAACMLFTGGIAYWNYRERVRKDFWRSAAHYRFSQISENITPWKQMYWTWWRMPEEEYNVYHKFKPYFILGQLDYSKEILIPKTRNGHPGFNVVNPLYCYEGGKVSMQGLMNDGDSVKVERAAVILNRGWIPAELRDKRSRPTEINSRQLVKINGCFRPGLDVHKYTAPNNPDSNEWNNMSLEDIGIFWDLPNYQEAKYYYFQAVDMGIPGCNEFQQGSGVTALSKDEYVDDFYQFRWHENTHQKFERTFGAAAAGSALLMFLSV